MGKVKIFGVGIDDSGKKVSRYEFINGKSTLVFRCPYQVRWRNMLMRCYSEKYQEKQPTYKGCTVCEEWLTFSNLKNGWNSRIGKVVC